MMTIPEAAAELGRSPSTLRWQIANGKLRARKVGTIWLVSRAELDRYRATSWGRRTGGRPPGRRSV